MLFIEALHPITGWRMEFMCHLNPITPVESALRKVLSQIFLMIFLMKRKKSDSGTPAALRNLDGRAPSPFDINPQFFQKGNQIRVIPGNHLPLTVNEEFLKFVPDVFFGRGYEIQSALRRIRLPVTNSVNQ